MALMLLKAYIVSMMTLKSWIMGIITLKLYIEFMGGVFIFDYGNMYLAWRYWYGNTIPPISNDKHDYPWRSPLIIFLGLSVFYARLAIRDVKVIRRSYEENVKRLRGNKLPNGEVAEPGETVEDVYERREALRQSTRNTTLLPFEQVATGMRSPTNLQGVRDTKAKSKYSLPYHELDADAADEIDRQIKQGAERPNGVILRILQALDTAAWFIQCFCVGVYAMHEPPRWVGSTKQLMVDVSVLLLLNTFRVHYRHIGKVELRVAKAVCGYLTVWIVGKTVFEIAPSISIWFEDVGAW